MAEGRKDLFLSLWIIRPKENEHGYVKRLKT
jgi:hypothetical protein